MASVKLMLNTSRILKNGTYPLVFQIIHNRRKKLFYTGFHIKKEELDEENATVSTNRGMNVKINREIRRIRRQLNERIQELELSDDDYTVDDILSAARHKSVKSFYLLQYIDSQIAWKKESRKEGTGAAYRSTKLSLSRFLGDQDIRMSQITSQFVIRYMNFLKNGGATDNTVNFYMRNFRTFYNLAMKDGFIPRISYPFDCIHTKPCKTVKRALSRKEMSRLLHFPLPEKSSARFARDLFLFSFYTQGMSFVDIVFLKWENVNGEIISYTRHKSKQLIKIGITPQIQELFERYGTDKNTIGNDGYIFPIINTNPQEFEQRSEYNQYRSALGHINRKLKQIADELKISIPLTTYVARHTWATLARENGIPVSTISAGLGHTTESMTQVYLKELDIDYLKKINERMNNLL